MFKITVGVMVFAMAMTACQEKIADKSVASKEIAVLLDSFNVAAATARYDKYFSYFTEDAIFIGTDATERWNKKEYMAWAKPYFDKKRTWNFSSIDRHISIDETGNRAWFDELLKTQMKICRGSGVLVKKGTEWKLDQYVLSTTVPNTILDSVISLKGAIEDSLIHKITSK